MPSAAAQQPDPPQSAASALVPSSAPPAPSTPVSAVASSDANLPPLNSAPAKPPAVKPSPAQVHLGATTVSGRLPPEVIQRVVRQSFGSFRSCYQQELAHNPELQGRVSARFVIGRDGSVSNVSNGGSDLADADVVSCVLRCFYELKFPQPEGGIVTVVYPIMLAPG